MNTGQLILILLLFSTSSAISIDQALQAIANATSANSNIEMELPQSCNSLSDFSNCSDTVNFDSRYSIVAFDLASLPDYANLVVKSSNAIIVGTYSFRYAYHNVSNGTIFPWICTYVTNGSSLSKRYEGYTNFMIFAIASLSNASLTHVSISFEPQSPDDITFFSYSSDELLEAKYMLNGFDTYFNNGIASSSAPPIENKCGPSSNWGYSSDVWFVDTIIPSNSQNASIFTISLLNQTSISNSSTNALINIQASLCLLPTWSSLSSPLPLLNCPISQCLLRSQNGSLNNDWINNTISFYYNTNLIPEAIAYLLVIRIWQTIEVEDATYPVSLSTKDRLQGYLHYYTNSKPIWAPGPYTNEDDEEGMISAIETLLTTIVVLVVVMMVCSVLLIVGAVYLYRWYYRKYKSVSYQRL